MAEIKRIISPDTQRQERLPPGQQLKDKWPVLHHRQVSPLDVGTWKFTIAELVEAKRTLTYDEFTSLPRIEVLSDIHCVTT